MKKFIIGVSIIFAIAACMLGAALAIGKAKERVVGDRNNDFCVNMHVYDFADMLTDSEEQQLAEQAIEVEKELGTDVVIAVLNDYSAYDEYGYDKIKLFAQTFYLEEQFGWNQPRGNCMMLVDNFYNYPNNAGNYETYVIPFGDIVNDISYDEEGYIIDAMWENTSKPFPAYKIFIRKSAHYLSNTGTLGVSWPWPVSLLAGAILTMIYVLVQLKLSAGKRTTTANTYVAGGHPNFRVNQDIFLSKHTTHRHIQRSSGGGGGGGGGGGHGGRH